MEWGENLRNGACLRSKASKSKQVDRTVNKTYQEGLLFHCSHFFTMELALHGIYENTSAKLTNLGACHNAPLYSHLIFRLIYVLILYLVVIIIVTRHKVYIKIG